MGLEGRLHLEWISSAEAQKFVRVVTDFTEKICQLGPNPLSRFTEPESIYRTGSDPEKETSGNAAETTALLKKSKSYKPEKQENISNDVRQWLNDGTIDVFLGYKMVMGHPLPKCFVKENIGEVDDLVASQARYSLEKIAAHLAAEKPDLKIGMLARDCTERALNVLYVWNQLNPENVKTKTINCCPSNLKRRPDCSYMSPEKAGIGKQQAGIDNNLSPEDVEKYDQEERLARWMYEFQKCIKCYGCRDICPVCFCSECSLTDKNLIGNGVLPPEAPVFHLVRAAHMAGRCIDCGLCEDACPMDIPLRLLYRKVNEIVVDLFDYETGSAREKSPFNIIGDAIEPEPMSVQPDRADYSKTEN